MGTSKWATIVKSNANYRCLECGSTELLQAHDPTGKHTDPRDGICLCAECHSLEHKELPKALFFNKTQQPYWNNISASSLAKELGVHPRTIIRKARKLEIPKGYLSEEDRFCIKNTTRIHHSITHDTDTSIPTSEHNNSTLNCLTPKDVAKKLHIHIGTLHRYINEGKIQSVRIGKRLLRIREVDFKEFVSSPFDDSDAFLKEGKEKQ